MNPASILNSSPKGLNVTKASWMFRPGAFLSDRHRIRGVQLEQVREVQLEEVLEVFEERPADHESEPAQEQVLRRQVGVGVRPPSRMPAARECRTGCSRSSSRCASGLGGGENGTYGPASAVGAMIGEAGAPRQPRPAPRLRPTRPSPAWPAWRPPRIRQSTPVCADARRPGSNSATTPSAAKPSLSCLLLRSRSLIACLPSASSPVVGRGPQRRFPPARARLPRPTRWPPRTHIRDPKASGRRCRLIRCPCFHPRRPG